MEPAERSDYSGKQGGTAVVLSSLELKAPGTFIFSTEQLKMIWREKHEQKDQNF
jgi:hypothetical protein